jgi:hypothetical protein
MSLVTLAMAWPILAAPMGDPNGERRTMPVHASGEIDAPVAAAGPAQDTWAWRRHLPLALQRHGFTPRSYVAPAAATVAQDGTNTFEIRLAFADDVVQGAGEAHRAQRLVHRMRGVIASRSMGHLPTPSRPAGPDRPHYGRPPPPSDQKVANRWPEGPSAAGLRSGRLGAEPDGREDGCGVADRDNGPSPALAAAPDLIGGRQGRMRR